MNRLRDERGFSLVEVLVAMGVLTVALAALMAMLSRGSLNVYVGGGQSKATAFARQLVEQLRNQPICNPPLTPPPCFQPGNGTDTPEAGITRTWQVAQVGGTGAPNRLWRITVTVTAAQSSQQVGGQSLTIETMRAE